MTSQQPKRAVQLIAFDSNKNPYLTTEAMSLLPSLACSNLHVIAVAGKYRTGKSYILNRVLLGRSNGFNVGHTINACTKGLWMWPELVRLGDKECLIIDTEGLGSLEEGESTDLKIFLLALLFSSHLIYNSAGSIDEQALESLSLVIQLAHVLQRQDRYDSQELLNTFPSFLWLLRDFSLKLEDASGNAISPSDYLETALKHQPKNTPAAERKNQIRKQLRTFFQERDCFALLRPTQEQKDLQNLSSLPESKLRPQFVKLISDLRLRLEQSVKPKRVKGRVMNMEGFIELCQYYTKALVDGKLPTISSHWDNLCLGQTHRILQKFQLQHMQAVEAAERQGGQMEAAHSVVLKGGVEAIEKSFLGKLEKQLFRERFERRLEKQFQELKMKATGRKGLELQVQLEQLEEIKNQDGDVVERYEAAIERMSQLCENTANQQLYCELYLYLSQFARALLQEADAARIDTQKHSIQRISMVEDQLQLMKKQQSQREANLYSEIQLLQRALGEEKANNSESMRGRVEESSEEIMHLVQTTKWQAEQIKSLESALAELQKHHQQLEKEKEKLFQQHAHIDQELQKKDIQLVQKEELLREESIKCRKLLREKEIVKHRYEEYLQQNLTFRTIVDNLEQKLEEAQRKTYQGSEISPELEQMRRALRKAEEEKRNITKLLNDERVAYQAMVQTPQNLNLVALKRNLELAEQQRDSLQAKLQDLNAILASCQSFRCAHCRQNIAYRIMKEHSKRCQPRTNMEFDVSYSFNEKGQIHFEIEVQMDNKQWTTSKSLTDLQELLSNLQLNEQNQPLFEVQGEQEWPVNKNEQRRIFIGELLQRLGDRIWEDTFLLCFLGIRTHSELREEKENQETLRRKPTFC